LVVWLLWHSAIVPYESAVVFELTHYQLFRRWVAAGGVAYFLEEGFQSSLFKKLALVDQIDHTRVFKRMVSSWLRRELMIQGLLPSLVIEDHPITAGVNQLYLVAESRLANFKVNSGMKPILRVGGELTNDYYTYQ